MPELPACYGKLHIASCVKENSAETLLYQKKEKKKKIPLNRDLNYTGRIWIFHHITVLEGTNLNIRQFKNTEQQEGQS